MPEENPSLARRVLRVPVEIVVALYVVADTVVSLLFSPVVRVLSSLRIVQRLERAINALPAYVILVIMVVPFIVAEFAKVFALFWMSEGHVRSGTIIFVGAYIVSIFVCERILHAGKPKLMTIPWFAWSYDWIMRIRDHVFGWVRATAAWQAVMRVRDAAKALARRTLDRLRGLVGARPPGAKPLRPDPRGVLERR